MFLTQFHLLSAMEAASYNKIKDTTLIDFLTIRGVNFAYKALKAYGVDTEYDLHQLTKEQFDQLNLAPFQITKLHIATKKNGVVFLKKFLESLGLVDFYYHSLLKQGVDFFPDFAKLNDDQLKELGILPFHRKKIRAYIPQFKKVLYKEHGWFIE